MPVRTHTVKQGETLSGIAQRYGVQLDDVTGYSSGNPDVIRAGENLTIGTPEPAQPVNRIRAEDLNQPALTLPPTIPATRERSLQTLAQATTERIEGLSTEVERDEKEIRSIYDQLGQKAADRVDAYAKEKTPFGTVNVAQKELQDINSRIKQREMAYRRRIEKIQDENPEGQLAEGQRLALDKIEREWAREAADLSLVAEVKLGNFNAAKSIIDEKIDAETEALQAELAGLQMFYSQNYNRLSEERRTQLQQETAIVSDELEETRNRESQIGELQLAAAQNGAPVETVLAIGRSVTVEDAIVAAGQFVSDRRGGTGTSGSNFFTKTQKAKGASAAGVSLEEFEQYDTDTQNFFLNSYTDATKMVDEEFAAGASLEEIQSAISDAGIPAAGATVLAQYASDQWENNFQPLSPEEEYSDIVSALTSYQEQGYSRDEAFDAELGFQTQDDKGKDLGLPKSQRKQIERNIKDALVDVYGRTFWQRVLPGGR